MNNLLILAFLFFMGSTAGWLIEVIYRRFVSQKKWVNPGLLNGPYLPIYGLSLCIVFILSLFDMSWVKSFIPDTVLLFIFMALTITGMEYIGGMIFIKKMNIKLWDYSDEKFNIQGVICLKYTIYWYIISSIYYFFIHPHIINSIIWLANNLAFCFFIGMFYGIFLIDFVYSLNIVSVIKKFSKENEIVLHYEMFKEHLQNLRTTNQEKRRYLLTFKMDQLSYKDHLNTYLDKHRENK